MAGIWSGGGRGALHSEIKVVERSFLPVSGWAQTRYSGQRQYKMPSLWMRLEINKQAIFGPLGQHGNEFCWSPHMMLLHYITFKQRICSWMSSNEMLNCTQKHWDIKHIKHMMYLFTTVPHPHGHWQLQELLGNHIEINIWDIKHIEIKASGEGFETHVGSVVVGEDNVAEAL